MFLHSYMQEVLRAKGEPQRAKRFKSNLGVKGEVADKDGARALIEHLRATAGRALADGRRPVHPDVAPLKLCTMETMRWSIRAPYLGSCSLKREMCMAVSAPLLPVL